MRKAWWLLLVMIPLGCSTFPGGGVPWKPTYPDASPVAPGRTLEPSGIEPVSYQQSPPHPNPPPQGEREKKAEETPRLSAAELSLDLLVDQVLTRNPTLPQMIAAWEAAQARYPQAISLDDPMFGAMVAPPSFNSNTVEAGYSLEASQKIPFPGKRRLRGRVALAEAAAAGQDVDDVRLQLIESAALGFYDYFLVDRALSVNDENLRLLNEFRQNAETRYKTGQVPQQDILQADVEIGKAQERRLALERMRQVAIARLNTLMHLPPDAPLLPPPKTVAEAKPLQDAEALRARALAQRPDLQALANRIAAEEAGVDLAYKEYKPDFEVLAAYNTMMGNGPMQDLAPQVGVRMNLPVQLARRRGAVAEAKARLMERRAELDRQIDLVNFEVQQMYAQVVESEKTVQLYQKTILPAARQNVKAAQAAYVTGKIPFLTLVEAQRSLVELLDRSYEAVAEYHRRRASLERMIGGGL